MGALKVKIDNAFEQLGHRIVQFRWLIVILTIVSTVFMASRLPYTKFDMSTEGFLHKKDPSIIRYNAFREQFGRDEMIVIMVKPKNIFDLKFLNKLKSFHKELEQNVPHLNDITSLINARSTTGTEGELIVEDLLEEMPSTEKEMGLFKEKVMSNPMYRDLLISEDGALTTIVIKSDAYSSEPDSTIKNTEVSGFFESDAKAPSQQKRKLLTNEENSKMVLAVRNIMDKYNSADFPLYLTGSPVVTDYLKNSMQKDMGRFTLAAIVGIAIFLFVLFRRASGVVLPLLTVMLSVIFTFALMELSDTPLKLPLVILPSFLLAIGIGASVHLMAIFFKYLKSNNKKEAIEKALGHSGLPIVMTSITTAAGLASFSQAQLAPIADLGVFASIGVLISLSFTLFLIPALISIVPIKPIAVNKESGKITGMDVVLKRCGDFAVDHRVGIVLVVSILTAVAFIGIMKLNVTHHVLHWFPKGSEIRTNTELIDAKMKGTLAIEVVLDTQKVNGLYEPDFLNNLQLLTDRIIAYSPETKNNMVGKTIALTDLLKEINQALNENKSQYYSIPQNRELVAQELFLFENSGSDDLEDMVDSQFSKTHLTIKVPWDDSVSYIDFFSYLNKNLDEIFIKNQVEVTVTGITEMLMTTVFAMMKSTIESYALAALIITILMIFLIGRLKMGLLSMIPNLLPIIFTLGIMGWLHINLDMFSMLIGSIAMGLAVDDTIHFFHNFKRYYDKSGNVRWAIEETLTSTGRAMLITTLVLATGFWLFMFATMQNLFYFGLLTGITLIFAFVSDILLSPALLALTVKNNPQIS